MPKLRELKLKQSTFDSQSNQLERMTQELVVDKVEEAGKKEEKFLKYLSKSMSLNQALGNESAGG